MFYSIIRSCLIIGIISGAMTIGLGQQEVIKLNNPSFEGTPTKGADNFFSLDGWLDCGIFYFPRESPPDVQPNLVPGKRFWGVSQLPQHGNTYIGMVVRENETWESLTQKLSGPLQQGNCYSFTVYLCQSKTYLSAVQKETGISDSLVNFTKPAILKIWGGNGYCKKQELLAQSPPINNSTWKGFVFKIQPNSDIKYLVLEARHTTGLWPYNGHILMDNLSDIKQISCSDEREIVAKVEIDPDQQPNASNNPPPNEDVSKLSETAHEPVEPKKVPENKKLIEDLDRDKIKVGQTIRIDRLFFAADKAEITDESYPVLDEIATFLQENEDVIIEIGGHTNTLPEHSYCDKLSTERAKSVYDYMIEQGIPETRLRYKGYGKRKPLTYADSHAAQKRNQRVEIKILSVEG